MRVRSVLSPAAFLAAAFATLAAIGCGGGGNPKVEPSVGQQHDNPGVDVGADLYPKKPDVKIAAGAVAGTEPLVIGGCNVQFEQRQQVSAEVDGKIELLAVRDDEIAPTDPLCVYHPRDVNKQVKYRKIKEGAEVKVGQVIAQLDDQIVSARMDSAKKTREAALEVQKSAQEGVKLSRQKADISESQWKSKTGSFVDYLQDMITLTRFEENRSQALQTIAKADADYEEARVTMIKHRVASSVNGRVRNIARHAGEFVKAGEKILEVQATDVVRLEGSIDVQYQQFIKPGMIVSVEPAIPSAPVKSHRFHQKEITGVAVSANADRPLVVSTSADGSARVWDATRDQSLFVLPHPVPVRSVACTPAGVKSMAITGADDGKVRLWDLSNPDKLPSEPRELPITHAAAIGAVAASPNGQFFATAAGREVFVWSIDGKLLYTLPPEHRDAVTSLAFTPQCTLITASKDRSLKVWKLGSEKAGVARTIDHRAGVIDVVGVTADGGRVVYDQDKDRLDIVGLADRHSFGQVQNSSPTAAFAQLAVFNPTDSLLLTAGGDGELKGGLQIWNVPPAGGRGSEVARLFTPNRVPATAAAFSPDKNHPFLVVGTASGGVHLWKPPAERKPYTGRVVFTETTDASKINVRVEMNNPKELNLLDRSTANVIINPAQ
jgi:WD40 repeat protein